jgi:hypothetical protein
MFDGTAKDIIMIEIEIYHLAVSINTYTRDVVPQILSPIVNAGRQPLSCSPWIASILTMFVPIPEPKDESRNEQRV